MTLQEKLGKAIIMLRKQRGLAQEINYTFLNFPIKRTRLILYKQHYLETTKAFPFS